MPRHRNGADPQGECRKPPGDARRRAGTVIERNGKFAIKWYEQSFSLNPKDVNDAPSGRSAGQYQRDFNSVPDQYVVRAGVGAPVWRNIGASIAYRVEGVPRYDVVGRSDQADHSVADAVPVRSRVSLHEIVVFERRQQPPGRRAVETKSGAGAR